jgi:hypothetical protein
MSMRILRIAEAVGFGAVALLLFMNQHFLG